LFLVSAFAAANAETTLQLRFQANNFALPWPIVTMPNETGTDWILRDIVPFLRVAFAVTNEVIEKSFLPMRRWRRDDS